MKEKWGGEYERKHEGYYNRNEKEIEKIHERKKLNMVELE